MIGLLQKITELLLNIQDALLNKNVSSQTYVNTINKSFHTLGATLSLNSKKEKAKEKIEANLEALILKHKASPEKLLKIVEKNGTKVYRIKNAKKMLKVVSQEIGLIAENYGLKALYINIITKQPLSFKTEPVFIIEDNKKEIDKYWLLQQVHKWYASKMNLAGFDTKSQDNFNKYMTGETNIDNLTIDDIIGLKEAIARDVEAINFVVKMSKATDSSKKALKKITLSGASI